MCVYMNCQQICRISPKKTWPKWKSVNCLNELESSDVCDSRLCFWRACLVVQPFCMTDRVLEAAMSGRFLGCLRPRARDRKWCSRSPWAARRPTSTTRCVLVMAKHTSILHTPDAGIHLLSNLAMQSQSVTSCDDQTLSLANSVDYWRHFCLLRDSRDGGALVTLYVYKGYVKNWRFSTNITLFSKTIQDTAVVTLNGRQIGTRMRSQWHCMQDRPPNLYFKVTILFNVK